VRVLVEAMIVLVQAIKGLAATVRVIIEAMKVLVEAISPSQESE
jgi:hypothetical protein